MRHHGRVLYPSTLAERRLLLQLGGTPALRIRRGVNPFLPGRRLARAARNESPDLLFVREVLPRPGVNRARADTRGRRLRWRSCWRRSRCRLRALPR
jgi:hypothetical protein